MKVIFVFLLVLSVSTFILAGVIDVPPPSEKVTKVLDNAQFFNKSR